MDFAPILSHAKERERDGDRERELGRVLKGHCTVFSLGLQCIQNCCLTVAPHPSVGHARFSPSLCLISYLFLVLFCSLPPPYLGLGLLLAG